MKDEPRILVFGGTIEGRRCAEWLSARGDCSIVTSSLTEYGGSLVEGLPNVRSLTGRMLPDDMGSFMRGGGFACVVDATHPYAAGVSANIASCAEACGIPVLRVVREGEPDGPWTGADSPREAAEILAGRNDRVLLTTGSKDLATFVEAIEDFEGRLFVRILPVASSLAAVDGLGIPASHVIAMQGPFSQQMNEAIIREFDIGVMVTKASGAAGGFWEKAEAAQACGIDLIVIHRPVAEKGFTFEQAKLELDAFLK